jgi:hypothetical protein
VGAGAILRTPRTIPLFVHAYGGDLVLDPNQPADKTGDSKDSGSLKFAGGNPWKAIGTWTDSPKVTPRTLKALGDLRLRIAAT